MALRRVPVFFFWFLVKIARLMLSARRAP